MSRSLDAIDADLAAVEAEGRDYRAETKRLIAQVEAARRDGIDAIEARARAFKQEQRERLDVDATEAAHPWTGKKVEREEITYSRGNWTRCETGRKTLVGIVETVTSRTEFAANESRYGRPGIGAPIVRLLKKDGSPGLKYERLHSNWKLVQDAPVPALSPKPTPRWPAIPVPQPITTPVRGLDPQAWGFNSKAEMDAAFGEIE